MEFCGDKRVEGGWTLAGRLVDGCGSVGQWLEELDNTPHPPALEGGGRSKVGPILGEYQPTP